MSLMRISLSILCMKIVIDQFLVFFTIKRQAYPPPCSPLVSVLALNSFLLFTTCLPCMLSPGPIGCSGHRKLLAVIFYHSTCPQNKRCLFSRKAPETCHSCHIKAVQFTSYIIPCNLFFLNLFQGCLLSCLSGEVGRSWRYCNARPTRDEAGASS